MQRIKLNSLTLIFLSFFFLAKPSLAFTLIEDGTEGFKDHKLTINLNPTDCPSSIRSDINRAIDLWQSVTTSNLELKLGSDSSVPTNQFTAAAFTEKIIIGCSTSFSADLGGAALSLGGASNASGFGGKYIVKGYVLLNMEGGTGLFSTKSSVEKSKTIAHELGHVLGLGHSTAKGSLMTASTPLGTVKHLTLNQDDIDGISYLYPRNELGGDLPFGCGLITFYPPNTLGSFIYLFLLLLPLLLLIYIRKTYTHSSLL